MAPELHYLDRHRDPGGQRLPIASGSVQMIVLDSRNGLGVVPPEPLRASSHTFTASIDFREPVLVV